MTQIFIMYMLLTNLMTGSAEFMVGTTVSAKELAEAGVPEGQVEDLLAAGVLSVVGETKDAASGSNDSQRPEDPDTVILEAIDELDRNNPELWTRSGKPQVSALEAVLGFDINSAERDAAWERHNTAARDQEQSTA